MVLCTMPGASTAITVFVSISERLGHLLLSHRLSGQSQVSSIVVCFYLLVYFNCHHTLSEMCIHHCQGNCASTVLQAKAALFQLGPQDSGQGLRGLTVCQASIYHWALSSVPGSQGPQRWQRLQQALVMSWLDEAVSAYLLPITVTLNSLRLPFHQRVDCFCSSLLSDSVF